MKVSEKMTRERRAASSDDAIQRAAGSMAQFDAGGLPEGAQGTRTGSCVAVAAALALMMIGAAIAQTGPEPGPGPTVPERMDPSRPEPGTEPGVPGGPRVNPGGVIRPPAHVDPGIHAPAPVPEPRTTPVIPPPGAPGGDPRTQPR